MENFIFCEVYQKRYGKVQKFEDPYTYKKQVKRQLG